MTTATPEQPLAERYPELDPTYAGLLDAARAAHLPPLTELTPEALRQRLRTGTVLVWFHGGGWVTGDLNYSDGFCRLLADSVGCEVRSVDYRLAPEHAFPAAVEDAVRAVRWTAEGDRRIVVAGDSAGGN